ncbi:MAG TPA: thioredoxin [Flavobacteriaceae bacterium]|nr:thioredoxin [Flavobacteriaceae bacterium]
MKSNFQKLIQTDNLVLIDFSAEWCGPCQTLAPILKDVKSDLGDDVKIMKIDIDKNQAIANQFSIRSVPTLILFKNGKEIWKQSGVMTKADLVRTIKSHQ